MRWRDGRRGDNVHERRARSGRLLKFGVGGVAILAAAYFLGLDPKVLLGLDDAPPPGVPAAVSQPQPSAAPDELSDFVSDVLADTEDTWTQIFAEDGETYIPPRLRYFEGSTRSGCDSSKAEFGPFYCAADKRVYIDRSYYQELTDRFHAPGEFALAYVIAHEVGHHVQNLMGTEAKLRRAQEGVSPKRREALQLRLELQADCYAGIWAHNAGRSRKVLAAGALEDALQAAAAVGEDMVRRQSDDLVVPDPFTHGSTAQRLRWFQAGLRNGLVKDCDTFGSRRL